MVTAEWERAAASAAGRRVEGVARRGLGWIAAGAIIDDMVMSPTTSEGLGLSAAIRDGGSSLSLPTAANVSSSATGSIVRTPVIEWGSIPCEA